MIQDPKFDNWDLLLPPFITVLLESIPWLFIDGLIMKDKRIFPNSVSFIAMDFI